MKRRQVDKGGDARPAGYVEHGPPPALAPFVECFWTTGRAGAGSAATDRVLPDGCIDILFEEGRATVVGAMTRALLLPPGPRAAVVAVRFRPGGAAPLLGLPAHALTDRDAPLDDIWRDGRDLAARVADASSPAAAIAAITCALSSRAATASALDPRVGAAVSVLARERGAVSIARLCARLGLSRQHLARLFEAHVGHGPKLFARVVRLRAAVDAARAAPRRPDWAAIAFEAGYADQAHMITDFRALAGVTPARFLDVPNLQYGASAGA